MSVKAKWFDDVLPAADDDPFQAQVEVVGKPIDLTGEPRLNERLIDLVNAESELFNQGITCPIKDRDDTACCACPVARSDGSSLATLCAIGAEEERVCTALAVLRGLRGKAD